MFRGEVISYFANLVSLFMFPIIGLIGLLIAVFNLELEELHYSIVFFIAIAYLIMGSQLQFFKSHTGIRTFKPDWLRKVWFPLLLVGSILFVMSSLILSFYLLIIGFTLYMTAVLIHFYWISNLRFHHYARFPLNYFYVSSIFFIIGLFLQLYIQLGELGYFHVNIPHDFVTHVFALGWILLSLMGALLRVLPMFIGKALDSKSKLLLNRHYILSVVSVIILLSGFAFDFVPGYAIGGSLVFVAWIWALWMLFRGIKSDKRKIINVSSAIYIIPGLFWITLGLIFGMANINRILHIHITLFAGLMLIMLGVGHRVTVFQVYTLLYTGKRQQVRESEMIYDNINKYAAIFFNIGIIVTLTGFIFGYTSSFIVGGSILIVAFLIYFWIIVKNHIRFIREKDQAIPFHLKKSEYKG